MREYAVPSDMLRQAPPRSDPGGARKRGAEFAFLQNLGLQSATLQGLVSHGAWDEGSLRLTGRVHGGTQTARPPKRHGIRAFLPALVIDWFRNNCLAVVCMHRDLCFIRDSDSGSFGTAVISTAPRDPGCSGSHLIVIACVCMRGLSWFCRACRLGIYLVDLIWQRDDMQTMLCWLKSPWVVQGQE